MIDMVGKLCLAMGYQRPFVAKCCSLFVRVPCHYPILRQSCEIRSTQTVGVAFGGSVSRNAETKSHFFNRISFLVAVVILESPSRE